MQPSLRTAAAILVAGATALSLGACSSTGGTKPDQSSTKAATPMDRLEAAKKVVDTTSGIHLKLSSNNFPAGATGVTAGEGDGSNKPDFKGTLNAQLGALQASVPVVAVDGKVWAKLPIWPTMREIKPADYGAPDPAKLFSANGGMSSLLTETKDAKFGNQLRIGADITQEITGTLSGADLTSVLAIGEKTQTYQVSYDITPDNRLVQIQIVGKFVGSTDSTYVLELSKYGQKIAIQAP